MFFYLDIPRLSWGFSTPNMLAAFLTILLAAVITAGDLPCLQKRFLQAGLWVLLIAGEILLGLTYSRGGYLAWLTVLAVYYFITRRKKVFVCLLIFFAVLVIIPAGVQRAASSANISEGSIANRLYLWRGALGTVAEFPVSGSPYPIGDYYELQYMPPEINAEYRNFLNDILTLGGNYGLGAIFAAVFLLLFLLYTGISCYRQCGFAPLPGLTAGIAGAFIAGCFSTFYHVARIRNAWIMLAAALSAGIVWCCIRKKWHFRLHHLLFSAAGAAAITIAIYTAGKAVTVPYKVIPEWENQKFTFIPAGPPAPRQQKLCFFIRQRMFTAANSLRQM